MIVPARNAGQFYIAHGLFLEYAKELDVDLCFQGFAEELGNLPGMYGPPDGELLLATNGGQVAGCVALRRFSSTDAEMKRLYVRPDYRHFGFGRVLAEGIVERARDLGYRRIILDTLDTMASAQTLYRSLGFSEIDTYYDNPLPGVLYFAKDLSSPP